MEVGRKIKSCAQLPPFLLDQVYKIDDAYVILITVNPHTNGRVFGAIS